MNQTETLGDWLDARPFTLAMSSGFFSFFAHLGMLDALLTRGIVPARVTGSSAGALVGGCWAAGVAPAELEERLMALRRQDFWDPAPGPGLLRGDRFRTILRELVENTRLEDTAVPFSPSVWSLKQRATLVPDQGELVETLYASCAVPLLFHPGRLPSGLCWDGGIGDRPGLAATGADEQVFCHHILSRSPWRRRNSPALRIPQGPQRAALAIEGLPRSGPGRLDAGRQALHIAREATARALDTPLKDGIVRIRG